METTAAYSRRWSQPVAVRIGYGSSELIRGPAEAAHYLQHRWPADTGLYFEMAVRRCGTAINLATSAEEAREIFISAAIEAYVLA
ncbi:DUF982 domain-containing protein [Neorhizobium galegae]|uniref:DUF982 domain-containing protein n=1 Tax=Neorhizobium galegae TaxID=399 RepID=UPI00059DF24F|nr:DUF982 domain-containing protein [Neorhizobium galegae]